MGYQVWRSGSMLSIRCQPWLGGHLQSPFRCRNYVWGHQNFSRHCIVFPVAALVRMSMEKSSGGRDNVAWRDELKDGVC